jgi:hypothetical protein
MEIKRQWTNVIKRLQSAARQHNGTVIIQVGIVVNGDGVPLHWVVPKVIPLEPKLNSGMDSLRKEYSEEQLHAFLNAILHSI